MSSTSPDSSDETEITLYNPSSEEAEELDPASLDQNVIDIEIDRGLAERLLEVSQHLGLNPTIVASRAIDLVCEEIGTLDEDWREDEDEFGTVTLIQRYQARVDLLQVLKEESDESSGPGSTSGQQAPAETGSDAAASEEEEGLWEAVNEIQDVLDEEVEDEDVGAAGDEPVNPTDEIEVKEDESPPTEEFNFEDVALEEDQEEADADESPKKSSRWSAVSRIMNVFSGSDTADEDDEAEEQEKDESDDEKPPTAEFAIDDAVAEEDSLEQAESEEEEAQKAGEWDAVETIIEQGEQSRK